MCINVDDSKASDVEICKRARLVPEVSKPSLYHTVNVGAVAAATTAATVGTAAVNSLSPLKFPSSPSAATVASTTPCADTSPSTDGMDSSANLSAATTATAAAAAASPHCDRDFHHDSCPECCMSADDCEPATSIAADSAPAAAAFQELESESELGPSSPAEEAGSPAAATNITSALVTTTATTATTATTTTTTATTTATPPPPLPSSNLTAAEEDCYQLDYYLAMMEGNCNTFVRPRGGGAAMSPGMGPVPAICQSDSKNS